MPSSVVHDVTVPLNRPEFSMRLSVVAPGRLVKELSIDPTEFYIEPVPESVRRSMVTSSA